MEQRIAAALYKLQQKDQWLEAVHVLNEGVHDLNAGA
jgi:hypothetical protein